MCYPGGLRSLYDHLLSVPAKLSNSKVEVVQEERTIKGSQVLHDLMSQRGGNQIQMAEVPGSILTGVTFCCCILCPNFLKVSIASRNFCCQY